MGTRLFITVDTEVCAYDPALDNPDTQIWGRTVDGVAYGVGFIMDELSAHGWTCTFFLNVYDTDLWGEESIAAIARTIRRRGFDVQLHTHIEKGLSSCPLFEQRRILREGADMLEKWTGVRPTWHRAGNLCANLDTVRACESEGFVGDSSYLYGWPQCMSLGMGTCSTAPEAQCSTAPEVQCSTALCADSVNRRSQLGAIANASGRNLLRRLGGIMELPITTFRTLPMLHNYRHLDIDACTYQELISTVRQAVRQGMPEVVMLMHSFSFVRRMDSRYVANMENVIKFKKFLGAVGEIEGLAVVSVSTPSPFRGEGWGEGSTPSPFRGEGWGEGSAPSPFRGEGRGEGSAPSPFRGEGRGEGDLYVGLLLTYHRAWAHWGRSWKHKVVALAPLIVAILILVVILFLITGVP